MNKPKIGAVMRSLAGRYVKKIIDKKSLTSEGHRKKRPLKRLYIKGFSGFEFAKSCSVINI